MNTTTPSGAGAPDTETPQRRSRWGRFCLFLLLALVAAAYFAPVGAARYLDANGLTLQGDGGTTFHIQVGEASLGWFSPVRLRDVRIEDTSGQPVLVATKVVSERSLSNLLADLQRPGRFFVEQPTMSVVMRSDGSNLEDLLRVLQSGERSSELFSVGGTITEGKVTVTDGQSTTRIEDIHVSAKDERGADRAIALEWKSVVVTDDDRQPVIAAVDWHGPNAGLPFLSGVGTFAVSLAPIPVAPWQSHLERWFPGLTIDSGTLEGHALVTADFRDAQAVQATGEFVSRDLHGVATSAEGVPTEFRWPEERLTFKLDGERDVEADVIRIKELNVESTPVGISATGKVNDVNGACNIDVDGRLRYDVDRLMQSWAADYREQVRVDGLRTTQFGIHGPLAAQPTSAGSRAVGERHWDVSQLAVTADLTWNQAYVYGVVSERATVHGSFHDGVLHVVPQDVPVSGGRYLAPLDGTMISESPLLTVGSGPALENVQFSEEMCRLWLKFLSPVMADATRVSGRFSIDLDGGQFPLERPEAGQIAGVLHIHEAEARPGPFAEQVFGLIETIRSLIDRKSNGRAADRVVMTLDEQQVPFSMANGRVRHEGLTLTVAGAAVRTSGSVGMDESLDLLVEVSLPESWFKQNAIGKALSAEPLRIPVRGTLDRPQFDQNVIRDLTRKLAVQATGGLLQKLFD